MLSSVIESQSDQIERLDRNLKQVPQHGPDDNPRTDAPPLQRAAYRLQWPIGVGGVKAARGALPKHEAL